MERRAASDRALSEPDFNPYASSEAPAAPEEVPRSRLRFYAICLAASLLLSLVGVVRLFGPPDWLSWPALVAAWVGGVLWILWPELRQPGGVRNISVLRFLVVVIGFVVMTYAMSMVLTIAWLLLGLPTPA